MTGSHEDPRVTADDEAAEWLLRHDDELDAAGAARFEDWLAAPVNRAAWVNAQTMWADFDLEPDPLLVSIQQSARFLRRPLWRSMQFQGVAMAASILMFFGFIAWNQTMDTSPRSSAVAAADDAIRFSAGTKRREIALADGSHVLLDARSMISYREAGRRREVEVVAGQAYFQVFHDASRPFVVAAAGRTVTATGTAFSVSLIEGRMVVVLERGGVTVERDGNGKVDRLTPGQTFIAAQGQRGRVQRVDVEAALAWRTGYLELHNVSIAEAVERMNRYAPRPVTIGDAQTGALRISGQFRTDDPERFVETLSELYPVRIRRDSSGSMQIVSSRSHHVE